MTVTVQRVTDRLEEPPVDAISGLTLDNVERDRRIILTEDDFTRLRQLASHPQLASELDVADVVEATTVPADVVTMNSRVLFEDETRGERREVTIVFPQDADTTRGHVSVLAPVGTALLGLAAGQAIVWPFPDGTSRSLRVLRVVYQPEAELGPRTRRDAA